MSIAAPHEIFPLADKAKDFIEKFEKSVPVILTKRLRLRAPKLTDFEYYSEIALSPSGRFILETQNREAAWLDFANMIACWFLRGHGLWAIETRENNSIVGFVLIGFEPGDLEPELGYMLRSKDIGKGYATEAAIAAKQFAFDVLRFSTLVSTIDHDNAASIKIAQKLGGIRDMAAENAHGNLILVFRYAADGGELLPMD